jgi:hypothetical protein
MNEKPNKFNFTRTGFGFENDIQNQKLATTPNGALDNYPKYRRQMLISTEDLSISTMMR